MRAPPKHRNTKTENLSCRLEGKNSGGALPVVVASTTYPSTMERSVGQGNDGARAGLGNKHAYTRDVPRFGALVLR